MASTWTWTAQKRKAAILLAEDTLPKTRIAEEVGVTSTTLSNWRQVPEFEAAIQDKVKELDEAVTALRFVKRRERLEVLSNQASAYLQIIEERAAYFAQNEPEVPGGKSGHVTRREKTLGSGSKQTTTVEYEVDTGTDRQLNATLVQIAKERGEWSDKKELTGPGGSALLPIVEIEVTMPAVDALASGSDDED